MEPLRIVRSRTMVVPLANVDTDQIIPARFLTTTTKDGLGKQLFADWRYLADGAPNPDFVLNQPAAAGCRILVAGRNFGCGSSREHAPWALVDYGIRAVISTEMADIFRSNSLKNGLLPVVVDEGTSAWLIEHPGADVSIDLDAATLTLPTGVSVAFPIEAFARHCLLNGLDELGYLQSKIADIERYEARRPSGALTSSKEELDVQALIAVLGGDGIGPEVTAEAVRALSRVADRHGHSFRFESALIGGAAIDASSEALPAATLELCRRADAILLGAVGGPKWSDPDATVRPEQGLLQLRKALGLFANLRPVVPHPAVLGASPIKSELLQGVDIMVVRELTGGIYFGDKQRTATEAFDVCRYSVDGDRARGACRGASSRARGAAS